MAKLHGAAKAAFLARMARGRGAKAKRRKARRAASGGHKRRKRAHARKRHPSKRRHHNPGVEALLVNPTGGSHMARRRKHHKKHRSHGRRRHHNPMGGGLVKGAMGTVTGIGLPAAAAGAAFGFVDAKFLAKKSPIVRIIGTIVAGVAAAVALKRKPAAAAAAAGAILGNLGYQQGFKMGGGLAIAPGQHGLGVVLQENPAMVAELGTVLEMQGVGEGEGEGMAADVDGMGDDVASGL
jgi:hypothetical protein